MSGGGSRAIAHGVLSGGLSVWKFDLLASNKHLQYVPVITFKNIGNMVVSFLHKIYSESL